MPILKLTRRTIEAIEPVDKPTIFYDSELTGFCLKVLPSGVQRWCVEYRSGAGGRSVGKTRMVLGSTTSMTPDQARATAKSTLAAVALGQDPARKRSTERAMPTFADFGERYLSEEAETKLKPRTVVNYRIYLRKHAAPLLGTRKLDALDGADVSKMHRKIGKETPMSDVERRRRDPIQVSRSPDAYLTERPTLIAGGPSPEMKSFASVLSPSRK